MSEPLTLDEARERAWDEFMALPAWKRMRAYAAGGIAVDHWVSARAAQLLAAELDKFRGSAVVGLHEEREES